MRWVLLTVLLLSVPDETLVADFEDGAPEGLESRLAGTRVEGGILLINTEKRDATVTFPLSADMTKHRALTFRIQGKGDYRWLALSNDGRVLYQRRFEVKEDGWQSIREPLSVWRWGATPGEWSRVRQLTLRVESPAATVRLDDVKLVTGKPGADSTWIRRLAFGADSTRGVEKSGIYIATDETEGISDEELDRLMEKILPVKTWIRRIFEKACRPVAGDRPSALLVFSSRKTYVDFFRRLGDSWRVDIAPPRSGGYTIHDLSASFWDAKQGVDRPVFFHEAVHAIVVRDLRLVSGVPAHDWLQEGIANYLQLCLHPKSIDRNSLVRSFARGVGERLAFRPLKSILGRDASTRQYAQLATLIGFLVERRREWLRILTRETADGASIAKALKACGADFGRLQQEWLDWGRERFAEESESPRVFSVPQEWIK